LLARSNVFVDVASEKLLTYATGRAMTPYDMPAVRSIAREAERNNYRFSSLVLGVVKSVPFQMRSREAQARAERERDSAKPQEQGVASREAQARQGEASIEEQPAPKQESIQ